MREVCGWSENLLLWRYDTGIQTGVTFFMVCIAAGFESIKRYRAPVAACIDHFPAIRLSADVVCQELNQEQFWAISTLRLCRFRSLRLDDLGEQRREAVPRNLGADAEHNECDHSQDAMSRRGRDCSGYFRCVRIAKIAKHADRNHGKKHANVTKDIGKQN